MRALVTGASGFLGSNLCLHLRDNGAEVWGSTHSHPHTLKGVRSATLDVCVPSAIEALLDQAKPDVIYHLGAMADPDACARDLPATRQINVQGSKSLAQTCAQRGIALVFASSDQVFDGTKSWWREEDATGAPGAYGKSKADAEKAVLEAAGPLARVARIALCYGWGRAVGRGFAENWLKGFLMAQPVKAYTDQFRTPLYVPDLCKALLALATAPSGTYHLAGPERVSRHQFGKALIDEWSFSPVLLQPASVKDTVFVDPRPSDVSLAIEKARTQLGWSPLGVAAGLQDMHKKLETLYEK